MEMFKTSINDLNCDQTQVLGPKRYQLYEYILSKFKAESYTKNETKMKKPHMRRYRL